MSSEIPPNSPCPRFTAVIVAAGKGTRLGSDTPKQYLPLCGKPILRRTIDTFLSVPELAALYVVIDPSHRAHYEEATKGLSLPPPIFGSTERQLSIRNALAVLEPALGEKDPVLIHDAARPLVSPETIRSVARALSTHPAASAAIPVSDTLRRESPRNTKTFGDTIERSGLWTIQTPQGFHFSLLKKAHDLLDHQSFTDDTGLVSAFGADVQIVPGSRNNIKITLPEDIEMAERLLGNASLPRTHAKTAMGFDVHAFGEESISVRIGGINIPHDRRLAGHSDADVVLHAITDAVYGVLGDGDIGSHFPPSNPEWKGKDSAFFLESAAHDLAAKGGTITHVDTTIICEAPKIGPHRDAMRTKIAEILNLPLSRVSVKATTTEGLGFTGRGEGIAAQAIVSAEISE
jgi:2-C-methyl-D-erythritol 4-phosphate cytidylyltransferase/2-C-methyl-D-erythritol 2,4-cyclodiphosphate synthase